MTMSATSRRRGDPELDVPVRGLAQDVAGEHQARADLPGIEEAQQVLTIDGRLRVERDREAEPGRVRLRGRLGQDQPGDVLQAA